MYINIHQLIYINISPDGQPIAFVQESVRPIRNDWLIDLIGIASNYFFPD